MNTEPCSDAFTEAELLYDAGLSVYPLPRGSGLPFRGTPLDRLQTTRLSKHSLRRLMAGTTPGQPEGALSAPSRVLDVGVVVGRHSGNLFVVDCTTPSLFERVDEAFTSMGIYPWIRDGSRGGQFWLRCRQGVVDNRPVLGTTGRVEGKILGNRGHVLAPPSVDGRTGMVYAWTQRTGASPPVVDLRQMAFLDLQLRSAAAPEPRPAGKLPLVAHRVLVEQDASGYENHDRRAEYAATLSLVASGYSDDDILNLLQEHAAPYASGKTEAWIRQHFLAPARKFAGPKFAGPKFAGPKFTGPSGLKGQSLSHTSIAAGDAPILALAQRYRRWAEDRPWPGRTGGRDRVVYLTLCLRIETTAQSPVRASVREVAEGAGITKMSAHRALNQLMDNGLIIRERKDPESGAYCYCLVVDALTEQGHEAVSEGASLRREDKSILRREDKSIPCGASSQPMSSQNQSSQNRVSDTLSFDFLSISVSLNPQLETQTMVMVSQRLTHPEQDAWVRSALGLSARQVHEVLLQHEVMTVGALHEATGRCPDTVRYALKKLELHGLATRDRSRRLWCGQPATPEVLAEVAARTGSAGRCARRRAGHQQEREQYAASAFARAQKRGRVATNPPDPAHQAG